MPSKSRMINHVANDTSNRHARGADPSPVRSPDEAIKALAALLRPVAVEPMVADSLGRVLASPVIADRDSPAADVSAMDGYACTGSTLQLDGDVPVLAEAAPGQPPPDVSVDELRRGVVRIFTGAIVPPSADRVIKREDTNEASGDGQSIRWREEAHAISLGAHIRRAGENLRSGATVISPGTLLGPTERAAMANFGVTNVDVHRRVRVAVLTTGNELINANHSERPMPWQLRNSNAVAIGDLLATHAMVHVTHLPHAVDEPAKLQQQIASAIDSHDVVLMTGGVSMGEHDYVPNAVVSAGCRVVFHKLPIRPGKPILGAIHDVGDGAKLVIGLPGNPVSATINTVRFALPLIRLIAGMKDWQPATTRVSLREPSDKMLRLHWMRPIRLRHDGSADLMIGRGSGDVVSLCHTDGFIEMPPDAVGRGPWPLFRWDGR